MAVEVYSANEFGYFSIIKDTEIFNNVVDASTAYQYFPRDEVYMTFVYQEGERYGEEGIEHGISAGYKISAISVSHTGSSWEYLLTTLAENRQIRVGRGPYPRQSSAFVFNDVISSSTNANCPIGEANVSGYSSIAVLLFNDDMSDHKAINIVFEGQDIKFRLVGVSGIDFKTFFEGLTPYVPPEPDPYDGLGEDDLPGGEIIGMPTEPTLSPIDAGLFSLYSPTAAQMRNLADFLWTDFGGTGTTVEQVLEEVVEALKRSVSNPLNSMLGLSIIASQGLSKGSDSSVRVGFWNTGVSMTTITKQYFTVDCGSLSFSPVCGNTFLDYAPYSKFMIYLPYVGMRLLDANDVVGHTISVRYRGDCVSGALVCYIIRDGSVIQEHMGNCALNIPLTADSWAETISGVAQLISGTVSGAAMGGSAAAAAAGAVRGAASVATNPSAFSPQVAHTGAVSGAAGHLGSQKPFILREAVRFHSTGGFNGIIGYPAYYYRKLGDCHGYTQCLEVHLSHTPCTGVELQEIEELLKKGVII